MKGCFALLAVVAASAAIGAQEPAPTPAFRLIETPPTHFIQGDPADSLYKLAHELLARGEYGRSAQLFKEIGQKYPKSGYQDDLPYNEAFARYRIGTTKELETAARLLEPRASKALGVVSPSNSISEIKTYGRGRARMSESAVVGLYIQVNKVLAQRGNRDAAEIVKKAAQPGVSSCDGDEMQLRREAMGALSQMDPPQALPIIRSVLSKTDECTTELRRSAVFMLGRRGDAEAATIIASTAKSDPSTTVRAEAINWLPKLQGDAGVNMLEEILRTEQDERILRAVVRTLASSDNPRARTISRALIDRKDAPVNLRTDAVNSFTSERATADDAAYLRGLYARADNDQVKEAIIGALGRIGGQENDEWILNIAKNQNEPSRLRAAAVSRLMRSNMTVADVIKLYDASESLDLRTRLVSALDNRRETEAADKLAEIARTSTVPAIKLQALQALTRRKDPRAVHILEEIMRGRNP